MAVEHNFYYVPWQEAFAAWRIYAPLLERGIPKLNDGTSLMDVYIGLLKGELQLWSAVREDRTEGVGLTTMFLEGKEETPICCVYLFYGPGCLRSLGRYERVVSDWARLEGCEYLRFGGRRGWQKIFKGRKLIKVRGVELLEKRL